jgi:Undecaprenyl-phosphate galactose phosphotransferase WbaP
MELTRTVPRATNEDRPSVSVAHTPRGERPSRWPIAFGVFFGDVLAFAAATALGGLIAYLVSSHGFGVEYFAFDGPNLIQQLAVTACIAFGVFAWFARIGHYTERHVFRTDLAEILSGSLTGLLINGFIEFADKTNFSRLWLITAWTLVAIIVPLMRIATRMAFRACGIWNVNAVIIGEGPHRDSVKRSLSKDPYLGYKVITDGTIADAGPPRIEFLLKETKAGAFILIPSDEEMQYLGDVVDALNIRMIQYKIVPPIDRLPLTGISAQTFISSDAVMLTVNPGLASPLSQAIKRTFDIAVSSILLLMLIPTLLPVALAVSLDGGPIFFAHERVGRRGKPFKCLKFRSLVPNASAALEALLASNPEARREWQSTQKLRHDPRRTQLGRMLRATSIDELPQLFNVLFGDMSLVGPRPVVHQELLEHYKRENIYYLLVRPGITGLWQISGRNETSYEERVHLDAWYARNWSLWGDIIILARTLPAVVARTGAS